MKPQHYRQSEDLAMGLETPGVAKNQIFEIEIRFDTFINSRVATGFTD